MKHYIRTITWRFSDPTASYPGLPNEKIYINSPDDVLKWFAFLFKDIVNEEDVPNLVETPLRRGA